MKLITSLASIASLATNNRIYDDVHMTKTENQFPFTNSTHTIHVHHNEEYKSIHQSLNAYFIC